LNICTRPAQGARQAALERAVGAGQIGAFHAERADAQLLGNVIHANLMLLGYAWQVGRLPVSHAALLRAMALNGVQVERNTLAFEWGRRCAHDPAAVEQLFTPSQVACLHTDPAFTEQIAAMFEGDVKLVHHLAPPLLARCNARGDPVKQSYGPWIRRVYTLIARRNERAFVAEYTTRIDELLQTLTPSNQALAVEIARVPETIRRCSDGPQHAGAAAGADYRQERRANTSTKASTDGPVWQREG